MFEFSVAIPARFASTRLPGKPLQLIGGKPMICHVAERALAAGAAEVVIATDDERIAEAVKGAAVRICMTKSEHHTGTDRLSECAQQLNWPDDRIVVNLQGDEPFAPAIGIRQVAELLAGSTSAMATLGVGLASHAEFMNPNVVKLVHDGQGRALYFSRAPIPWPRDIPHSLPAEAMRHIGIYAYRSGFLQQLSRLPVGKLERCESLEQLRVLENGFSIAVAPALAEFRPGVDTWEDLAAANAYWLSQ